MKALLFIGRALILMALLGWPFALLMASAPAQAQSQDARYCSVLGSVYQSAAFARDNGRDPEAALKLTDLYRDVVPEMKRIAIVNQVYFDARLARSRGESLRVAVRDFCLQPAPFKPITR